MSKKIYNFFDKFSRVLSKLRNFEKKTEPHLRKNENFYLFHLTGNGRDLATGYCLNSIDDDTGETIVDSIQLESFDEAYHLRLKVR